MPNTKPVHDNARRDYFGLGALWFGSDTRVQSRRQRRSQGEAIAEIASMKELASWR